MDKRITGLAGAMREIAEQRDDRLRNAVISADRLERLRACLAAELPVETALFAAGRRRDESLSRSEPVLPAAVHARLREQARSVRSAARPLVLMRQLSPWMAARRVPRAYQRAAAVAAAAVIAFAALHFFPSRNPAIHSDWRTAAFANLVPAEFSKVSIFDRSAGQLSARVNRLELASLELSLLPINRSLPDLERPDRVLPLDLPARQIRLDVEAVRTP